MKRDIMSESKHTPGPWKTRMGIIWGHCLGGCNMKDDDFMVAMVRGWGHLQYLGENEAQVIQDANARLIAAAPQTKIERDALLDACKYAVRVIRRQEVGMIQAEAVELLKAAIALTKKEG